MTEQAETYENSDTGESKPKKRGPKAKKARDLEKEIDTLKACLAKMAHFSGNQRIISEFGIEPWKPGQKDMHRFSS